MAAIVDLCFEWSGEEFRGCFLRDAATGRILAEAEDGDYGSAILRCDGREYTVAQRMKRLERLPVPTPYPLSSKGKKTIGFEILEKDERIGIYYPDAVTVGKLGVFKKNMAVTVYSLFGRNYTVYRIGFAGEPWHYYRLMDEEMETVAMLRRNYSRKIPSRATVYVEEEAYLPLAMVVCAGEMLAGVGCGLVSYGRDPSAGNYISILEAEKNMIDRAFLDRVREQAGVKGE